MNPLDRAISWVAPSAGLRRVQARGQLQVLESRLASLSSHVRRFEAASRSRRTQGWKAHSTDANLEASSALVTLRDRHRDLARNNPYVSRALRIINANVVGHGIMAKPATDKKRLGSRLAELWNEWALDHDQVDTTGQADVYGLQSLLCRAMAEGGDAIVRRIREPSDSGLAVPLRIQLLEGDYLDETKFEERRDGTQIIQGVEFSPRGRAVAYWIFDRHPGAGNFGLPKSQRVPAEDIALLFRPDRIGQARGLAWGAPCMLRVRNYDGLEDAVLLRAQLSNAFVGVFHDLPGAELDDTPSNAPDWADEDWQTFQPGTFKRAPPGMGVEFSTPPEIVGYNDFSKVTLRAIAGTYEVSYAALANDLEAANFSSSRMGWIEQWMATETIRWQHFIPRGLDKVWRWFSEAAVATGRVDDLVRANWTPPRREMLDPTKEVPAAVKDVRAGFSSLSEVARQRGYNLQEVLEELRDDLALVDKLGLKLESDGRVPVAGSGTPQGSNSDGKKPKPKAGDDVEDEDDDEE